MRAHNEVVARVINKWCGQRQIGMLPWCDLVELLATNLKLEGTERTDFINRCMGVEDNYENQHK